MGLSGGSVYEIKAKKQQDEALEHLASSDLIELCREAKVERCRAARDLRSCGRYVEHVLNSCGHASLCAECSQRYDTCPICRIPMPKNGNRLRLRLYYECIEAGLISKRYSDRLQEKEDGGKQLMADVQRLYSLFDVALENNLVSLVCHYVTDVCMDESAVSSDPVLAFLLDEVVVKDWCKRTFRNITAELGGIYTLGIEDIKMKLSFLLKFAMQLSGISNVLEVLESSFKETISPQLQDLHHLSENILKAKQHLEVMTWCVRHQFLEDVSSRYPNFDKWRYIVCERKSAATKRSWPRFTSDPVESGGHDESTLFIEDALSNLGVELGYKEGIGEELGVTCLQDEGSSSLFRSKIDEVAGCYPFENLRAATDILFLRGSSDLVVAKRAIFLYYLFDRHWSITDAEWRPLIDDFAATFGLTRCSLLESLTFYLLDDLTEEALQEACRLLPEIAGPSTHPKIAQVLLERQKPDAALMVLRCSGREGLCAYANAENGEAQLVSLGEAVTAIRVRVECGLLTEAFMYQRTHCLKVKEEKRKHGSVWALSNNLNCGYNDCIEQMDVLVNEICLLCIRRNLLDRMIELPWNSDEEKYIHKCLFDNALQDPSTTSGSLLVVFYLQRYRYIEAYQVNRKLQDLEEDNTSKIMSEELASKIRSTSQWRAGLVDKCIELLPEVQQQQVKTGNLPDFSHFSTKEVELPAKDDSPGVQQRNPTLLPADSAINSPLVLGMDTNPPSKKITSGTFPRQSGLGNRSQLEFSNHRPPTHHGRLFTSIEGPSTPTTMDSPVDRFATNPRHRDSLASTLNFPGELRHQIGTRRPFQFDDASSVPGSNLLGSHITPLKELNRSSSRMLHNEKSPFQLEPNGSINHVENARPFMHGPTAKDQDDQTSTPGSYGLLKFPTHDPSTAASGKRIPSDRPWTAVSSDEALEFAWSGFSKRDSPAADLNANGGPRWRSDETSEDEEDPHPERIISGFSVVNPARETRRSRFRRR
ncbi:ubiquitin-protein ligase [Tasmannia lanceolata]|uniref:ubiquitin-protein ligase n=1 Tax=Tasmannia lanceolata TaxID=3420 RepID=UPI004063EC2B